MNTYQKISEARSLLDIPERATLAEIKSRYRSLISKWHPDRHRDNKEQCHEMASKINTAYKLILAYCNQYEYSFAQEEVKKYISKEEWWHIRFGSDPVWGKV